MEGFKSALEANAILIASGGMHQLVDTTVLTAGREELLSGTPLVLYATDRNGQRVANPTNDLAIVNTRILGELTVSASTPNTAHSPQ